MPEDLDHQNVIDVTMDDLDKEQMKLVLANVDNYMKLCLESFGKIRNKVVQKAGQLISARVRRAFSARFQTACLFLFLESF